MAHTTDFDKDILAVTTVQSENYHLFPANLMSLSKESPCKEVQSRWHIDQL